MNMTLIYFIILELTLFYLLMFLIILFLAYFDYMFSVVRLELCLCIRSYSAYSLGRWVSDRYCVGEVPRPYLTTITPYSLKLEVDRGSDSSIGPFIPSHDYKDCKHHYYRKVLAIFMIFLANITMHRYIHL